MAFSRGGRDHARDLWKMMAFAARYGHTGPNVTRHMTVRDLTMFVEAVGNLIEEESEAVKRQGED